MNPQSATLPAPAAPANGPAMPSGPNIVTSIPVHTPQAMAAPVSEESELDKIMQDVGQELKKEDKKPQKHGLLDFLHHDPKPLVKVNNQPARPATGPALVAVQAAPSIAQSVPVATTPAAAAVPRPDPLPLAQPQAAASPDKPKVPRHIPVFAIFVALCVTGFLIAAAIAAYR